jgi:hypothetical protein
VAFSGIRTYKVEPRAGPILMKSVSKGFTWHKNCHRICGVGTCEIPTKYHRKKIKININGVKLYANSKAHQINYGQ